MKQMIELPREVDWVYHANCNEQEQIFYLKWNIQEILCTIGQDGNAYRTFLNDCSCWN